MSCEQHITESQIDRNSSRLLLQNPNERNIAPEDNVNLFGAGIISVWLV